MPICASYFGFTGIRLKFCAFYRYCAPLRFKLSFTLSKNSWCVIVVKFCYVKNLCLICRCIILTMQKYNK